MAQARSNVTYIQFENHKIPEFKEVKNKNWVYFGEDNNYPEYLIELALRSAKHGAILSGKVNYIYGGGLEAKTQGASLQQQANANAFIKILNKNGFLRRTIQDFETFNGFYIEPIFNKAKTKLVSIEYIPFSKIRVSADEKTYFYSNDWSVTRQDEKTGYKEYKAFDMDNITPNQLYYHKLLSPKNGKDKNVYPVPEYIGACASIETDVEIANYHLNNIKTGFSVGTMINFNNGVPEEAAQLVVEKQIKKKFQGTDKAGSVAITFNNSQDNAPTITSFAPSDLDKQFIEIGKRVEQDIFTGHKITSPMLFGVKTEGQLGGRSEMIDAFELFQNTYIDIRQKEIESVINAFAQQMGVTCKIELKRVQAVNRNLPDTIIEKVYNSYSVDQLIDIMGLPKRKITLGLSKEVEVEEVFAKYGKINKGTIIKEIPLEPSKEFDFAMFEQGLLMKFKSELTANERAIVDLLSKDSLMPSEAIAKVLKIDISEVNTTITSLDDRGYLMSEGDGITSTTEGDLVIENDGAKTLDIVVEYKYNWRPDVKDHNESHSREFCQLRMDESRAGKTYTSAELIRMSNDLGTNVWEFRGGWWNKDGANVPYCRHLWFAVVIKN